MSAAATALLLARLQFAFTVSFHFIFPSFTIGLASYLAVLEGLWLWTGKSVYFDLFLYWRRVFAIAFGMGVVSGIVLEYQVGTNWSVFADKAGPIVGPLMAYEVLAAFFLEAGFLGVMLFGMEKVGPKLHFLATCMVALGTLISAFFILSANSWMQTPVGWKLNTGDQFAPADWLKIVFNPSFPYRLVHTVIASYVTTSLVVGGAAAWHLLRRRGTPQVRKMFSMAMWMAALVVPVQMFAGDQHGLNTVEYQKPKIAAIEGHYDPYLHGAPLVLIGWPDSTATKVRYAVEIPHLSSLILHHSWNAPTVGLKQYPRDDWPPVPIVFWSFRIMVGLAFLMFGVGLASLWARWCGTLYTSRPLHWYALSVSPAGWVAIIAGWVTTEVGRQPWTVYGHLRTALSVSPIAAAGVTGSLIAFVIVYLIIFTAGAVYMLLLLSKPPVPSEPHAMEGHVRSGGITPAAGVKKNQEDGQ